MFLYPSRVFITWNAKGDTVDYRTLAVAIYVVGLLGWLLLWRLLVGYDWLKKEPLMYIPFGGGIFVLLVNMVLVPLSDPPDLGIEVGYLGILESRAKTIATFTLGVAVFVVVTFEKTTSILQEEERIKFLQWVFASFLLSVVGVLPLYWVPQTQNWLITLQHLKTVPYLYSLFTFAAAMVIYLYQIKREQARRRAEEGQESR
jgi:hypothetical protein